MEPLKTKSVRYFYPTSPGAIARGYGKCGCWVISATGQCDIHVADSGERAKLAAFEWAERCPGPYEPFSKFGPKDTALLEFVQETRKRLANGETFLC